MPWQKHVTELVLIVIPLLVIGWDIVAAFTPGSTISEICIHLFYAHPVLPLYLGMLFGHLTFPVVSTRPHWITVIIVVVLLALGFLADNMAWLPAMMPVIPLILGIPLGHLLWPQKVTTETGQSLIVAPANQSVNIQTRTMLRTVNLPKPK